MLQSPTGDDGGSNSAGKTSPRSAVSVGTEGVRPASTRPKKGIKGASTAAREANGATANQKLTHLVIDSGPIIKGAGMTLASAAENFWTVPEVVSEIRDKKARHHLEILPFELKLREPSDEAMRFAAGFARQTGDLRSLSRVDLRVIALTYMLERQETGGSHLRTAPVPTGTRVNSKSTGVSATTLDPPREIPQPVDNPKHLDEEAAGVDALPIKTSGEKPDVEETEATGEINADVGVESLCQAMESAWTEEVVADEGSSKQEASGRVAKQEENVMDALGGGGEYLDALGGVMAGTAAGKDVETRLTEGEDEEEEELDGGEVANGKHRAEGGREKRFEDDGGVEGVDNHNHGSGDETNGEDDEWEPEGEGSVEEEASKTPPEAGAADEAVFVAGDFPVLGLGRGDAAASDLTTPLPTSAHSASPPAEEERSWSLLARSNPAPFKVPAKQDPTPLPAAAPVEQPVHTGLGNFVKGPPDGAKGAGTSRILSSAAAFGVSSGGGGGGCEDDEDGVGWVTPSNIKSHKAAGLGLNGPSQFQRKVPVALASKCRAGCVTTDFAMQNVILQVGLPLLSLDGMAVRRVRQWILRCAACFKTCTEMGRLFCPVCGNASLDRVSCSVNAKTGATHVHLRKNRKVNLRGSKYSIPAPNPRKGRFEGDLLLREDQLLTGIWAQKAKRKEKDVSSMFGKDITGDVGLTVSRASDIMVGYGRKNPNAARGRERRGKKGIKNRP